MCFIFVSYANILNLRDDADYVGYTVVHLNVQFFCEEQATEQVNLAARLVTWIRQVLRSNLGRGTC